MVDNCNACTIAIEEEVDLTEESVHDMYKTMNSTNFASRMLANHPDAHHVMGKTLTNITEAINDQLNDTVYGNSFKLKQLASKVAQETNFEKSFYDVSVPHPKTHR
jgi:nitrate reductase beta subunit